MQKIIFTIDGNSQVAKDTFRLELSSSSDVLMHSGQFVDVALEGRYLRRPISVCDSTPGHLTLCYKVVGEGTRQLSEMKPGEKLDILTGLGHGYDTAACNDSAILIGGGLGAAPMHLLCKELRALGKKVTVVLGFNRADEILLVDDFKAMGAEVLISTMDGSVGTKGFVTDAIAEAKPEFDIYYTCGPLPMMKAVFASLPTPGQLSLEERMGCGAGFCYGCTCKTHTGNKRVCADGPVFNKEDLIW